MYVHPFGRQRFILSDEVLGGKRCPDATIIVVRTDLVKQRKPRDVLLG